MGHCKVLKNISILLTLSLCKDLIIIILITQWHIISPKNTESHHQAAPNLVIMEFGKNGNSCKNGNQHWGMRVGGRREWEDDFFGTARGESGSK